MPFARRCRSVTVSCRPIRAGRALPVDITVQQGDADHPYQIGIGKKRYLYVIDALEIGGLDIGV